MKRNTIVFFFFMEKEKIKQSRRERSYKNGNYKEEKEKRQKCIRKVGRELVACPNQRNGAEKPQYIIYTRLRSVRQPSKRELVDRYSVK